MTKDGAPINQAKFERFARHRIAKALNLSRIAPAEMVIAERWLLIPIGALAVALSLGG